MPSSLASLLHQSLDFAGLFPPASLPASEALRIFRQEQSANTAGMLARFVCPMIRLEETANNAGTGQPLVISALPRGGKNAGEFLANLETDLAAIRRLAQLHDGAVAIDTIELRPPADALEPASLRKLLAAIDALLVQKAGNVRQVFVELAPAPALASQLALLAEQSMPAETGALIRLQAEDGGQRCRLGALLRAYRHSHRHSSLAGSDDEMHRRAAPTTANGNRHRKRADAWFHQPSFR
jgi:hypothetical protein